jgi:hypothetical protein
MSSFSLLPGLEAPPAMTEKPPAQRSVFLPIQTARRDKKKGRFRYFLWRVPLEALDRRLSLIAPRYNNRHSLIEGYCLNLRQYSRRRPNDQSFFDHKDTKRNTKTAKRIELADQAKRNKLTAR